MQTVIRNSVEGPSQFWANWRQYAFGLLHQLEKEIQIVWFFHLPAVFNHMLICKAASVFNHRGLPQNRMRGRQPEEVHVTPSPTEQQYPLNWLKKCASKNHSKQKYVKGVILWIECSTSYDHEKFNGNHPIIKTSGFWVSISELRNIYIRASILLEGPCSLACIPYSLNNAVQLRLPIGNPAGHNPGK